MNANAKIASKTQVAGFATHLAHRSNSICLRCCACCPCCREETSRAERS